MTIMRKASRIARLEQALGTGADAEVEPFRSLTEVWESMAVAVDHRSAIAAGLCAYGEGLSPRDQRILQSTDHFWGKAPPLHGASEQGPKQ